MAKAKKTAPVAKKPTKAASFGKAVHEIAISEGVTVQQLRDSAAAGSKYAVDALLTKGIMPSMLTDAVVQEAMAFANAGGTDPVYDSQDVTVKARGKKKAASSDPRAHLVVPVKETPAPKKKTLQGLAKEAARQRAEAPVHSLNDLAKTKKAVVKATSRVTVDETGVTAEAPKGKPGKKKTVVKKKGAEATPVKRTSNANKDNGRMELFGQPVTRVLRWMGKQGYSIAEARTAMEKLKSPVRDATIATQIRWGRKDIGGPLGELTKEQVAELKASLK